MADRWIISSHPFKQHLTLAAAQAERDRLSRLSLKLRRNLRIMRIKTTVEPARGWQEMVEALREADACFEAALAEGFLEALADGDIERVRDIWQRRLSVARSKFPEVLAKLDGREEAA